MTDKADAVLDALGELSSVSYGTTASTKETLVVLRRLYDAGAESATPPTTADTPEFRAPEDGDIWLPEPGYVPWHATCWPDEIVMRPVHGFGNAYLSRGQSYITIGKFFDEFPQATLIASRDDYDATREEDS